MGKVVFFLERQLGTRYISGQFFPKLFDLSNNKEALMHDMVLGVQDGISISEETFQICWNLLQWEMKMMAGNFSVKSFHLLLNGQGVQYLRYAVWKTPVPIKFKIHMWIAIQNKLKILKYYLRRDYQTSLVRIVPYVKTQEKRRLLLTLC